MVIQSQNQNIMDTEQTSGNIFRYKYCGVFYVVDIAKRYIILRYILVNYVYHYLSRTVAPYISVFIQNTGKDVSKKSLYGHFSRSAIYCVTAQALLSTRKMGLDINRNKRFVLVFS